MSTTTEIRDSVYAELLAKSLPRPIRIGTERLRITEKLLALDGRDDLSPEEKHSPKCCRFSSKTMKKRITLCPKCRRTIP
jgi:hypothetical protein